MTRFAPARMRQLGGRGGIGMGPRLSRRVDVIVGDSESVVNPGDTLFSIGAQITSQCHAVINASGGVRFLSSDQVGNLVP
jgi:hypothetical protein